MPLGQTSCSEKNAMGGGGGFHAKRSTLPHSIAKVYANATTVIRELGDKFSDVAKCLPLKKQVPQKIRINPYSKHNETPPPQKRETHRPILGAQWESDDKWIHDRLPKKGTNTRLWLQNPNGVSAHDNFRAFRGDLEELRDNEIDFVSLPETKLNISNKFVCERFRNVLDLHLPNVKSCIANTKGFNSELQYQPGGVAAIATNKLAGRYAGQGTDKLGRYNWMRFCGKKRELKIYTFYRVTQSSGTSAGDTTAYAQQYNALNVVKKQDVVHPTSGGDIVKPKKHVIIDPRRHILQSMEKDILEDLRKNTLVIIMGDLNESIFTAEFNHTMKEMGMVNVLQEMGCDTMKIRSQNRGRNVIDGIWMSCPLMSKHQSIGVAPFYEMFTSDHRGIFLDIALRDVLDEPTIEFQQLQFRRLQSSIPKRTEAYIKHLDQQWNNCNMHEKIESMKKNQHDMDNVTLENMLNAYDKQIGEMMTSAEKRCTNISKHAIQAWSPKLGKAIKEERTIKKQIAKAKRCGVTDSMAKVQLELDTLHHNLIEVRKKLKSIKVDSEIHRKAHLDELIQENLEKNPNSTYAGELKRLKNVERQRSDARRIRNSHNRERRSGIRSVYIPAKSEYECPQDQDDYLNMDVMWKRLQKQNGKDIQKWEEVDDRNLVESMTLQCMMKHFGQANGTPLTSTTWNQKLISDDFITDLKNEDLESIKNESLAIQEYFSAMSNNSGKVQELDQFKYTLDDWKWHIKHVKEKTSTSPDGRHYGHFKVILNKHPQIFQNIYDVMDMAFQHGILLKRWKQTVTVLIPKDNGIVKIHRLRPLHLVEPEVNAVAKALWAKKLMRIAERTGKMTDDQYGGRKHRQAQSAVLNKILYYDINRMSVTNAQYDDIDMKSNYDRELPRLVSTEARVKLGLHKHDAKFMVDFTEQQQFFVKTAYGISETSYQYSPEQKLFGLGQGIAWSGPGWLLSSDTIVNCKKQSCVGMRYTSPIDPDLEVEKTQDMFVDDTTCGCNIHNTDTTLMKQAQFNSQKHSDYVHVTGGMVAADKCHFYNINWKFVDGIQSPCEPAQEHMHLDQGDGVRRNIKQLHAHEEHKTLGCWVNPLGVKKKAYDQIRGFMIGWKTRILHSSLPPTLIKQSYESELRNQIRYRMPVYMFDEGECDELMKIISPVLLHANYINKNYPRALLQANSQYGGLGITHLYDIMGMEKSKFLFMHLRRQDTTGKLFQISMQQTQLECGSETLFYNLDYDKYGPLTTNTWNTNLWQYYSSRAIEMDLTLPVTYTKPRCNDQFIMDVLMKDGSLNQNELAAVNKVRQHLQLLTLSDMTDVRGKIVLRKVFQGQVGRRSKFKFTKQEPTKKWKNWWTKKACPVLQKALNIRPLGQWKSTSHQIWDWEYDSIKDELCHEGMTYRKVGNVYIKKDNEGDNSDATLDSWADVTFDRNMRPYLIAYQNKKIMEGRIQPSQASKFRETYDKMWGEINYLVPQEELILQMNNKSIMVATDGSNWNDEGAHAWGVADAKGKFLVKGRGRVPCAKSDASSLRPELHALLAVTSYLSALKEELGDDRKVTIPMYTDSQNAITDMESNLYATTRNVLENNIDIKLELKQILRMSPIQFKLNHVKAHQDDVKPYDELTIEEKMNCDIDAYAGQVYAASKESHEDVVPFLQAQKCSLRLPFTRPTSNICEQLVSFANGHKSEDQLATYWNIDKNWLCNMEWKGFRTALRRYKGEHNGATSKLVHKQWATMAMMKRNGFGSTDICPMCENERETWDHVFRCKCALTKMNRHVQIQILRQTLIKKRTHPILQQRILAAIQQWCQGYEVRLPKGDSRYPEINEAFRDQIHLGIGNMLCGVISHKFGEVQQRYYDELEVDKKRLTKHEWNTTIIRALLQFSESMWTQRCKYVHEESDKTMQMQTRNIAWKIKHMILQAPWMIRSADRHLLKRDKKFFQQGSIINVQGWINRIQISIDIAVNHEQTTRQDIRKWISVRHHENKRAVFRNQTKEKKKYKQTQLPTIVIQKTQNHAPNTLIIQNDGVGTYDRAITALSIGSEDSMIKTIDEIEYEEKIDEEGGWNMGLLNLQYDDLPHQPNCDRAKTTSTENTTPITTKKIWNPDIQSTWFRQILGTWKQPICQHDQNNDDRSEEIIFEPVNEIAETIIRRSQQDIPTYTNPTPTELVSCEENESVLESYEEIASQNSAVPLTSDCRIQSLNFQEFCRVNLNATTKKIRKLIYTPESKRSTMSNESQSSNESLIPFHKPGSAKTEQSQSEPDEKRLPIVARYPNDRKDFPRSKRVMDILYNGEDTISSTSSIESFPFEELSMNENNWSQIETIQQTVHDEIIYLSVSNEGLMEPSAIRRKRFNATNAYLNERRSGKNKKSETRMNLKFDKPNASDDVPISSKHDHNVSSKNLDHSQWHVNGTKCVQNRNGNKNHFFNCQHNIGS